MMSGTLNMQEIRYLNLFSKITKINTRHFFRYNEILVFCVPKNMVYRAVGEDGKNVKKMSSIIKKKIKIVAIPEDKGDIERFIREVVSPNVFKEIEIGENEIIINAGRQNKASLLGRGKKKLFELQKISKNFFEKDLKIL